MVEPSGLDKEQDDRERRYILFIAPDKRLAGSIMSVSGHCPCKCFILLCYNDFLYCDLHSSIGYEWNINNAASLDLSAKRLWTRQEGDSVTVHGDKVRFRDSNFLRTRLNGRVSYAVNEQFTPYLGAY